MVCNIGNNRLYQFGKKSFFVFKMTVKGSGRNACLRTDFPQIGFFKALFCENLFPAFQYFLMRKVEISVCHHQNLLNIT